MQDNYIMMLFLSLVSASGYVAATYFMKLWGRHDAVVLIGLIAVTIIAGVVCEIIVLKHSQMARVYFVILGLECVLVAGLARWVLGEIYAVNELVGIAVIVLGIAITLIPSGQPNLADAKIVSAELEEKRAIPRSSPR